MRLRGRPLVTWILLAVLGQLSLRALVGGGALLVVPSGALVGLSTGLLEGTPFADFLVPGLVLLVCFGAVPVAVCYALYTRRRWGWPAAVGVAIALVGWLAVQGAIGYDRPTIYLNLGTAVAIVVLALHPAVRYDHRHIAG